MCQKEGQKIGQKIASSQEMSCMSSAPTWHHQADIKSNVAVLISLSCWGSLEVKYLLFSLFVWDHDKAIIVSLVFEAAFCSWFRFWPRSSWWRSWIWRQSSWELAEVCCNAQNFGKVVEIYPISILWKKSPTFHPFNYCTGIIVSLDSRYFFGLNLKV